MNRRKIGLNIDACVKRAERYIGTSGYCYLAMDIIGSSKVDTFLLRDKVHGITKKIDQEFMQHFVCRGSGIGSGMNGSFEVCRGDSLGSYICSAEAVRDLIEFYNKNYPEIKARWAVGKEAWSYAIKQL